MRPTKSLNVNISEKKRNSSIETYRIIATILVLMVHLNGWLADMPETFSSVSCFSICQTFIESLSCICVNCFIIITGWFGLKLKFKHFWTIYSVIVFIYVPFYLVSCFHAHSFSLDMFLINFIAIGKESYYIQCYLMLMFLAPVLNAFIEKMGKQIIWFTISFWLIEIFLDWILNNNCLGFAHGYGITHFILIYFLGRTAFIYKNQINDNFKDSRCIILFFLCLLLMAVMYFSGFSKSSSFSYTNPCNVIMAFSLYFIFEKKTFYNKVINWFSTATLAVHIFHTTPPVITILKECDIYTLQNYPY